MVELSNEETITDRMTDAFEHYHNNSFGSCIKIVETIHLLVENPKLKELIEKKIIVVNEKYNTYLIVVTQALDKENADPLVINKTYSLFTILFSELICKEILFYVYEQLDNQGLILKK